MNNRPAKSTTTTATTGELVTVETVISQRHTREKIIITWRFPLSLPDAERDYQTPDQIETTF